MVGIPQQKNLPLMQDFSQCMPKHIVLPYISWVVEKHSSLRKTTKGSSATARALAHILSSLNGRGYRIFDRPKRWLVGSDLGLVHLIDGRTPLGAGLSRER